MYVKITSLTVVQLSIYFPLIVFCKHHAGLEVFLKELGEMKQPHQTLVGFAAETQNLLQYAKGKLEKKNLDMIVANDVSKPQAGFNVDTNLIKLLKRDGSIEELPLMSKKELAYIILDRVMKLRK